MQRSAGVAIYDHQSEQITIRLSWDVNESYEWKQFSRVIRHKLIHARQYHEYGEANHALKFRQWVEPLEMDGIVNGMLSRSTGSSARRVGVVVHAIAGRRL